MNTIIQIIDTYFNFDFLLQTLLLQMLLALSPAFAIIPAFATIIANPGIWWQYASKRCITF